MNLYDWCVMNKDVEVEQCTILRHVENIKASHKDQKYGTTIIDIIICL